MRCKINVIRVAAGTYNHIVFLIIIMTLLIKRSLQSFISLITSLLQLFQLLDLGSLLFYYGLLALSFFEMACVVSLVGGYFVLLILLLELVIVELELCVLVDCLNKLLP